MSESAIGKRRKRGVTTWRPRASFGKAWSQAPPFLLQELDMGSVSFSPRARRGQLRDHNPVQRA